MVEDEKIVIQTIIREAVREAANQERQENRMMIRVITEEAINETFRVMGIDVTDLEHINEFRENQNWVKRYRRMSESIGSRVVITTVTILTGGFLAAVWAYMQTRGN